MNTSETINEIAAALAKAQGEMENATKNAQNPHFKNNYADLAGVLNAVRPVLSKHGVAIWQATSIEGNVMVLHTRLIHSSGQWLESIHPVCALPAKPQEIGSCETYARRYSLAAICGIAQEDDDLSDGKATRPVAAPIKNAPDAGQLMAAGYIAAEGGTESLKSWWTGLSKAEREAVGEKELANMKAAAQPQKEAAQ